MGFYSSSSQAPRPLVYKTVAPSDRPVGTGFKISDTRDAMVTYSFNLSGLLTAPGVALEISKDQVI